MKINRIYYSLIALLLLVIITSCIKEKFGQRDYPIIKTEQVGKISTSGAVLNGNIIWNDDYKIIDHGFFWAADKNVGDHSYSDKLSLGSFGKKGKFSGVASYGMGDGQTIYYRAFIKTDEYTVTGNTEIFTSMGCDPPVITGYSPHEARIYDTIYIAGENLSSNYNASVVYFGDVRVNISGASGTQIKAVVPRAISELNPTITYASSGHTVNLSPDFTLIAPEITGYSPASGRIGQEVTISGLNFPHGSYELNVMNRVYFGDHLAILQSVTDTEIVVYVPNRVESVSLPVRVESILLEETFEDNFTLAAPVINSITVSSGSAGSSLIIVGEGLHYFANMNEVTLGGIPVQVTSTYSNNLYVRIPSDFSLPSGDYQFVLSVLGLSSGPSEIYHYTAPDR